MGCRHTDSTMLGVRQARKLSNAGRTSDRQAPAKYKQTCSWGKTRGRKRGMGKAGWHAHRQSWTSGDRRKEEGDEQACQQVFQSEKRHEKGHVSQTRCSGNPPRLGCKSSENSKGASAGHPKRAVFKQQPEPNQEDCTTFPLIHFCCSKGCACFNLSGVFHPSPCLCPGDPV